MKKAIGIDIGGTSIKGIVIDELGATLEQRRLPTDATKGRDFILHNVSLVIAELLQLHPDVMGIGIGTAGRVNVDTGEVVYATDNLPGWQGTNLREEFQAQFHLPVRVDNDANTALMGEKWLGAGRSYEDITMLTLGTGVGGANMINGEIVRGGNWNGGEWGHVIFVPRGRSCNCGQQGCIEQYLSGSAFVHAAREATQHPYPTGVEVLADYERGNQAVKDILEQYLDDLTLVVHNIHLGINPQMIIIGGGLVDSQEIWWGLWADKVQGLGLGIHVQAASLGNRAGAIGAARLILPA